MAQPDVSTTDEGMARAMALFIDKKGEFSTHRQRVENAIANLRASFDGRPAIAFEKAMYEWGQGFNVITEQLNILMDSMSENSKENQRREESGVEDAGMLMQALPGF
ncbi:type VII secretion system (Wss) protein ESAT-6 [Couchioplanes caeruleus]|nr:type VII secretion system (Wss) protein ESAT-6 [Couchioplanes caeruleus]